MMSRFWSILFSILPVALVTCSSLRALYGRDIRNTLQNHDGIYYSRLGFRIMCRIFKTRIHAAATAAVRRRGSRKASYDLFLRVSVLYTYR